MSDKIKGRLLTPENSKGERKDIHLITTSDEVLVPNSSGEMEILSDVLDELKKSSDIEVGSVKPTHSALWFKTK